MSRSNPSPLNKRTFPLWKFIWLACVPIAISYQMLWGIYFHHAPVGIWQSGASQAITTTKFASELTIYSLMLLKMLTMTHAKHPASKVLTGTILIILIGFTGHGLFIQLTQP
ncbi:hypothetical protein [Parendozoicomonas haliclonae]|uniref:Uncharacterized protein n=1 Tax=Parendozoicomonas haliclonae TaxID=1960125 RepID=A0A1X7AM31_9GAMM|nr:hypothetical protein [Parendozoicomonas haliclonae]SMA48891.1 hypothetical protein EHSB41UT_02956 [Parendozoicomonas haliclonae]